MSTQGPLKEMRRTMFKSRSRLWFVIAMFITISFLLYMKGDLQIKFNQEMDWLSRIFEGANREGRYKLNFDEEDIELSKRTTDTQAYIF
ncbi:hypothetical protein Hanom_Chr16g01473111 [Helianthus anomalus]